MATYVIKSGKLVKVSEKTGDTEATKAYRAKEKLQSLERSGATEKLKQRVIKESKSSGKSAAQVLQEAGVNAPDVLSSIQAEKVVEATKKIRAGTAKGSDIITALSKGTGRINLLQQKEQIKRIQEQQKDIQRQKELKKEEEAKRNLLEQLKKTQQDKTIPLEVKKESIVKKLDDYGKRLLEDWASSINKRESETKKIQAERQAKILTNNIARKELVSEYVPTGLKTIGKGLNKLVKLGEETFIGTVGFGESLLSAGEKTIFLLPALGRNIKEGSTIDYIKEFVSKPQLNVLKQIYTDPETYKEAAIGAATAVLLGGIKKGKGTAKSVKTLPSKTKEFSKGTILRSETGNIGIVARDGTVKSIPKGMKTITRALTRDIKDFVVKDVTKFPKISKAKVGTVLKNKTGELRIVTKGGKTIKPTAKQSKAIVKSEKIGKPIRQKRTEVARLSKKVLKEPLAGKEARTLQEAIKLKQRKLSINQFNKEVNRISRKLKLDNNKKIEFTKLYKKFTKNPSKSNVKALKNFESKALKLIDSKKSKISIKKTPKKEIKQKSIQKSKKTREFYKKRGTTKNKVDKLKSESRNKVKGVSLDAEDLVKLDKLTENVAFKKRRAETKLNNYIKSLKKRDSDIKLRQSLVKADKSAQRKGFKNYKEQLEYNNIFQKYKEGFKGYDKKLKLIESNIAKRKTLQSKRLIKSIQQTRNNLVKEANKLLREGRIKIKDKKYKVVGKRKQLSKEDANRLALVVSQKLDRIEQKRIRREAKEVYKEILRGKEVQIRDTKLSNAVKDIINKELLRDLKIEKRLSIKGAKLKTAVSKPKRKLIKAKAKEATRLERIARKKYKRSPAGIKQERKIRRKQILKEIEKERMLLEKFGTDKKIQENYILDLTSGEAKLVPKTKVKSKIKFAQDIIKKKNLKKGQQVKINKDGTIQILETKKIKILKKEEPKITSKFKKERLQRAWNKIEAEVKTKQKPKLTLRQELKTKLKTKIKTKNGFRPEVLSRFQNLKIGTISTFTTLTKVLNKNVVLNVNKIENSISNIIKSENKVKIENEIKNIIRNENKLKKINEVLNEIISKSTIKNLNKNQISYVSKTVKKIDQILADSKKKRIEIKKAIVSKIKLKKPILEWGKEAKKGYRYKVDGYVKIGNKKIKVLSGLPENKAWNILFTKGNKKYYGVDNSTARSFQLEIVGLTKQKDDKEKIGLKKTRTRKGKDPKVLLAVEKVKYAIDKIGEKQGLKIKRSNKSKSKVIKMYNKTLKNTGFRLVIKPRTKKAATMYAMRYRKKGYNARIIPYKNGYKLYIKKK